MSGGSWDYVFIKVEDAAGQLRQSSDPMRQLLGIHLVDVAKALHDIEWVDSADYAPGMEMESIRKVLEGRVELRELARRLRQAADALDSEGNHG